jgi:hypothetical protein
MSGSSSTLPRSRKLRWVPAVLAVSAVSLAFAPRYQSPAVAPTPVPAWATDATPVRQPSPRPLHTVGAFTYQCSECHRTDPEPRAAGADFTKHSEIRLAHGLNTRCLNCHHPTNREAFVDDFGDEIPWDQPQKLCSKCHGPVYRDWQHGSHGRINGHWDTAQGELIRLKCIECHDPHHPPFQPLASAPPPRTLRGEPQHVAVHSGEHNPLRLHNNSQAHGDAAAAGKGHE